MIVERVAALANAEDPGRRWPSATSTSATRRWTPPARETKAALAPEFPDRGAEVERGATSRPKKKHLRELVLDDRHAASTAARTADIRQITCEVGVLPRTHGSALFTRGETQALVTTTLGTSQDEQRIEALIGDIDKRFMLHYNFPPFSTGEVKPMRGASRREIGHGNLAERAICARAADATRTSRTRSASCRRSSSRTAARRWRRCAAARWR